MRRTWLLRGVALVVVLASAPWLSHFLGNRSRPAPKPPLLVLGTPGNDVPVPPVQQLPRTDGTAGGPSATPTLTTLAAPTAAPRPSTSAARAVPPKPVPPAKTPILLGTIGSYSGVRPAQASSEERGLAAWATEVNRRGGLSGHPVRLVAGDDQGDPSTHLAVLNRLLGDGVVALVGVAGDESDDRQLLDGRGVPVLGALPMSASTLGAFPDFAPAGTSPDALTYGGLVEARAAGGSRLAVLTCVEAPQSCGRERALIVQGGYAKAAGFTVVYDQQASLASPTFTSQCSAIKHARADTVYVSADAATLQRLASSCHAIGADVRYVAGQPVLAGPGVRLPEGTILATPTLPWFASAGPAAARRAAGLKAAGVASDSASVQGWAAGALVERLVQIAVQRQGTHPGAVTGAQLRAAEGLLKGERLGGLAPALTGAPHSAAPPSRCWFLVRAAQGGYVAPHGPRTSCGAKP